VGMYVYKYMYIYSPWYMCVCIHAIGRFRIEHLSSWKMALVRV
jgi:hypothetical protein